jgi:hypothetical protein
MPGFLGGKEAKDDPQGDHFWTVTEGATDPRVTIQVRLCSVISCCVLLLVLVGCLLLFRRVVQRHATRRISCCAPDRRTQISLEIISQCDFTDRQLELALPKVQGGRERVEIERSDAHVSRVVHVRQAGRKRRAGVGHP